MVPIEKFTDVDFGNCKVLFKNERELKDVCFFASHTILPFIPDYVFYYLEDIKRTNFTIVFVSSSPICENDIVRLSRCADIIIEKENRGTDFGAWCAVLRWLNYGKEFQNLYLCNDSVFGLFESFENINKRFQIIENDLLGITDSHQGGGYHIQSFFIGVKHNVLQSEAWKKFWQEMSFLEDKRKVIEHYEIGLSQILLKAGFEWYIWADWTKKLKFEDFLLKVSQSEVQKERWLNRLLMDREKFITDINPSSFIWKELIERCESPCIKRELFILDHLFHECEVAGNWLNVLEKTGYPVALIKRFLVQLFFYKYWQTETTFKSLELAYFKPAKILNDKISPSVEYPSYDLFSSIKALLPSVPAAEESTYIKSLAVLKDYNFKYFPLLLTGEDLSSVECAIIYFDYSTIHLEPEQLNIIKGLLKEIHNLIIIVPDKGCASIVASLLNLQLQGILIEEDLFDPNKAKRLIEEVIHIYDSSIRGIKFHGIYQRPTLAEVVYDATNNLNQTNFIQIKSIGDSSPYLDGGAHSIANKDENEDVEITRVLEKYMQLYERTPVWFKKLGQIIKVIKGNKKLVVKLIDRHSKEHYKKTAEDIAHWYYLQYEVLPDWYKNLAKHLTKSKVKE